MSESRCRCNGKAQRRLVKLAEVQGLVAVNGRVQGMQDQCMEGQREQ